MKRLLWLLLLFLMATPFRAIADSVIITPTLSTLTIYPSSPTGYNVFFNFSGPEWRLVGFFETPADWFSNTIGYAPGSLGGGTIPLTLQLISAGSLPGLGGFLDITMSSGTLFTSTFTFPTNGQNFSIGLPATLSGLSGSSTNGDTFTITPVSGLLRMSFTYSNGLYYANQASFGPVPEPSTLSLFATGMLAVVGATGKARRRKSD